MAWMHTTGRAIGLEALWRDMQDRHVVLHWLNDEADDRYRKTWTVIWLAGGQTIEFTAEASFFHFPYHPDYAPWFCPISEVVLKDWMRRWWFEPAVDEVCEIQGFYPVFPHFKGKVPPDTEPPPYGPRSGMRLRRIDGW